MKTIIIHRSFSTGPASFADISIAPDSAVSRDGRPVFLPDEGSPWTGTILPAYRICRLGKNIPERFAPRYYDAMTIAAVASPAPDTLPTTLGLTTDGAISLGQWTPITEQLRGGDDHHEITFNGTVLDFTDNSLSVCKAIHFLSRFMTLKIGDIIIPSTEGIICKLDIDSEISADLDGTRLLEYRIK